MIRVPKEKLFELMFEMSELLDRYENDTGRELNTPWFDAMTKEIMDAGLVEVYFDYMGSKGENNA